MAEKNIKLEKTVYGTESADRVLDRKFTELIQEKEPVDIKKLFRVYEELFFDIPKRGTQSHAALIKQSFDYVRDYEDPKDKQIDDLLERIIELEEQVINETGKEHPFFKNGTMLYNGSALALMQNGERRGMSWGTFDPLRKVLGFIDANGDELDRMKCVTVVTPETFGGIPRGKDISSMEDLNDYEYQVSETFENYYDLRNAIMNFEIDERQYSELLGILSQKARLGQIITIESVIESATSRPTRQEVSIRDYSSQDPQVSSGLSRG